jgi:hypothetical protein
MANETRNINRENFANTAEGVLSSLKERANQAHQSGDTALLNMYRELIKAAHPIVIRAIKRYHREERAKINALGKDTKTGPNSSSSNA